MGFWMAQLLTKGMAFRLICEIGNSHRLGKGVTANQIALTWFLMLLQTMRRLFETSFLAKPSTSQMWVLHWILGIVFYLAIGIAIWVDGAGENYSIVRGKVL